MIRQVQQQPELVQHAVKKHSLQRFVGCWSLHAVPKQLQDISDCCNSCQHQIVYCYFGKNLLASRIQSRMADSFPHTDIARYVVESVTLHFATLRPSLPTIHKYFQLLTIVLNGRNENERDKNYQYNKNSLQLIALKTLPIYTYCIVKEYG